MTELEKLMAIGEGAAAKLTFPLSSDTKVAGDQLGLIMTQLFETLQVPVHVAVYAAMREVAVLGLTNGLPKETMLRTIELIWDGTTLELDAQRRETP